MLDPPLPIVWATKFLPILMARRNSPELLGAKYQYVTRSRFKFGSDIKVDLLGAGQLVRKLVVIMPTIAESWIHIAALVQPVAIVCQGCLY